MLAVMWVSDGRALEAYLVDTVAALGGVFSAILSVVTLGAGDAALAENAASMEM